MKAIDATYMARQCNSWIGMAAGRSFHQIVEYLYRKDMIIDKLLTCTSVGDTMDKSRLYVTGTCIGDYVYKFEAAWKLNPSTVAIPGMNVWKLHTVRLTKCRQ